MQMRDSIVDQATRLVRASGYAGFSYADLSEVVGIRKASIHHYFPSKEDLGVSMVETYRAWFRTELETIHGAHGTAQARLSAYAGLYRDGLRAGRGCLCGVLASEYAILPKVVQSAIKGFFNENIEWLERVLTEGRRSGEVRRDVVIPKQARMLISALQGATVVARPLGGVVDFDDAVAALLASIRA